VRILFPIARWAVCLMITLPLSPVFASGVDLRVDPAPVSSRGASFKLGACEIRVLDAYFWRDFMPIVSRPGPDGGSPLRVRVRLSVDNSRGVENKFSFRAVIVDEKGQSHPITFRGTQRGMMWDGEINTSEVREIELVAADGPYLPAGSGVHVEITWTDRKGDSVIVRTPVAQINRTD